MPTLWQRDLDQARTNLTRWLAGQLGHPADLELSTVTAPQGSGFSNETLFVDATWTDAGRRRTDRLAIRVEQTGYQAYPEYDLASQYRLLQVLAGTDVPVPVVRWLETEDKSVLGTTFYVMDYVAGRVPPDNPSYNVMGWLSEATPDEVAAVWWGSIDCLARVARLEPRRLGLDFLGRGDLGNTPIDRQLSYQRWFHDWAARGLEQPVPDAAWEWLVANRPRHEPERLVWGDARMGNVLYDGTTPVAAIDWESATLGSPETDLGWTLFVEASHVDMADGKRLAGLPSPEETVARWQDLTGLTVRHRHYYEVFAGYRFSLAMIRIAQQLGHYGMFEPRAARAFEVDNHVTRLLARLLNLPAPSEALDRITYPETEQLTLRPATRPRPRL